MNQRQAIGGNHMIANNWQLAVPVVQQTAAQEPRIHLKIIPAQPSFNCHFPYAGRAKEKLVFRIFNQSSNLFRKPAGFTGSP